MATGGGGGGGGARRRRKAGLPGLCWKTCYFPILFWVVSVCGEEKTLIVEVGGERAPNIYTHTRARAQFQHKVRVCARVCYLHLYDPPGSCAPRCVCVSEWQQVYQLRARCSFVVGARTERKQKGVFLIFAHQLSNCFLSQSVQDGEEPLTSSAAAGR